MPFDAAGFPPKPPRKRPRSPGDRLVAALIIAISAMLLATPFSLAACADIVRYVRG